MVADVSALPMWHRVVLHCSMFNVDAWIFADRHKGQLALRKLYHESDRLLVVLYTSPTCGPCRTLKPIFSKVVDDYPGKVSDVCDVYALCMVRASLPLRRTCNAAGCCAKILWTSHVLSLLAMRP